MGRGVRFINGRRMLSGIVRRLHGRRQLVSILVTIGSVLVLFGRRLGIAGCVVVNREWMIRCRLIM
jgi:hypothetical protein